MVKAEGKAAKEARVLAKAKARAQDTLPVLDSNYFHTPLPAHHLLRPASLASIWPMSHVTSVIRRDTTNLSVLNGLLYVHHLLISTPVSKPRGWASFLIISKIQFLHQIHAAYGARTPLATAPIAHPPLMPTISRNNRLVHAAAPTIGCQLQT
jgi:hypothetical protein